MGLRGFRLLTRKVCFTAASVVQENLQSFQTLRLTRIKRSGSSNISNASDVANCSSSKSSNCSDASNCFGPRGSNVANSSHVSNIWDVGNRTRCRMIRAGKKTNFDRAVASPTIPGPRPWRERTGELRNPTKPWDWPKRLGCFAKVEKQPCGCLQRHWRTEITLAVASGRPLQSECPQVMQRPGSDWLLPSPEKTTKIMSNQLHSVEF